MSYPTSPDSAPAPGPPEPPGAAPTPAAGSSPLGFEAHPSPNPSPRTSPPADRAPNSSPSDPRPPGEQVQALKGEVDQLLKEMEILRGWFQTLVSGLLIAVVISVGIASWFAYRLLEQEEATQAQMAQEDAVRQDLLKRVTQLEEETTQMGEDVGSNAAELRGMVLNHQTDLEQLRDRLNKLETRLSSLEAQNSTTDRNNE